MNGFSGRRFYTFLGDQLVRLCLIAGGIAMFIPLLWMISTALKSDEVLSNYPTRWWPGLPVRSVEGILAFDKMYATTDELTETTFEDWEGPDNLRMDYSDGITPLLLTSQSMTPRAGTGCLTFGYSFSGADETRLIWKPAPPIRIDGLLLLTFWCYGDASGHELDIRLRDERGTWKLTEPFHLTFRGWREMNCCFWPEDRIGDVRLFQTEYELNRNAAAGLTLGIQEMDFTLRHLSYPQVLLRSITENFARIGALIPLGLYFRNTLIVAFCIVAGQIITSCLAGFAFARLEFPGREPLFYMLLGTMMIPGSVTMIPQFLLIHAFGFFDTLPAIILPSLMTVYGTFLLRQFFMTIPRDLEDAARIDGCSPLQTLLRIFLPLSLPAVVTLGIISFLAAWGMFQWPLIVTKSQAVWTLQVGIAYMAAMGETTRFNLLMAAALVALLPQVIIFTLGQRAFREGIVLTGLKG